MFVKYSLLWVLLCHAQTHHNEKLYRKATAYNQPSVTEIVFSRNRVVSLLDTSSRLTAHFVDTIEQPNFEKKLYKTRKKRE